MLFDLTENLSTINKMIWVDEIISFSGCIINSEKN